MLKKGWITLVAVLLALGTVLVPASPAEAAKSTRVAEVLEVVGDAHITKSGGSKQFRLFKGMTLNQGDFLVTGPGAKVVLLLGDREDEVTVGENASLYLSELSDTDAGKKSKFKMWTGTLWNKVKALAGAEDEFEVETPTAVMGVRGTHFLVIFDPKTGLPKMLVASGKVEAGQPDSDQRVNVYPVFEYSGIPEDYDPRTNIAYIDPKDIVVAVDRDVLEEMLRHKKEIDEENDALLDELAGGRDAGLDLTDEEALERYRTNVQNVLDHLLRASKEAGVLTDEMVASIVEAANRVIADTQRQYDLDREVPPIDRSAGVDPEEEEQRRQQREAAEQRRKQQQEDKEKQREQARQQNQDLLDRLEQQRRAQEEENERAAQEKQNEAVERYRSGLTDEQREQLEQRLQQREAERQEQREAAERRQGEGGQEETTPPAGTTPGGGSGGGGSPGGPDDGGSSPGDPQSGTVSANYEVTSLDEEALTFRVNLIASDFSADLYAVEVHLTMPEVAYSIGEANSDLLQSDNAVFNIRDEYVRVGEDETGIEVIYAAIMKPAQQAVAVGDGQTLVSIPLRASLWLLTDYPSFAIKIDIIVLDENGEVIQINALDDLTVDFSEQLETMF